jgi:hypothetical protein
MSLLHAIHREREVLPDLFGDDYAANAVKLVDAVNSDGHVRHRLATIQTAVAEAAAQDRPLLLSTGTVKKTVNACAV